MDFGDGEEGNVTKAKCQSQNVNSPSHKNI